MIWNKSGIDHKKGIKTLGEVIDSIYTGKWLIELVNLSQEDYLIKKEKKQVLFQKIEQPEIEVVKELENTSKGALKVFRVLD